MCIIRKTEEKGRKQKMQKGVTLISLVVAIVVLIILAGISIGTLTGDKGIIQQANSTKDFAQKTSFEEKIDAAIIVAQQKHKKPSLEEIIEEIEKIEDVTVNRTTGEITNSLGYTITGKLDGFLEK